MSDVGLNQSVWRSNRDKKEMATFAWRTTNEERSRSPSVDYPPNSKEGLESDSDNEVRSNKWHCFFLARWGFEILNQSDGEQSLVWCVTWRGLEIFFLRVPRQRTSRRVGRAWSAREWTLVFPRLPMTLSYSISSLEKRTEVGRGNSWKMKMEAMCSLSFPASTPLSRGQSIFLFSSLSFFEISLVVEWHWHLLISSSCRLASTSTPCILVSLEMYFCLVYDLQKKVFHLDSDLIFRETSFPHFSALTKSFFPRSER